MKKIITYCMSTLIGICHAKTPVVTSLQCDLAKTTSPFLLVLYKGDNLKESLQKCFTQAKVKGAVISGSVGALETVTLGYYDRDNQKKYLNKTFNGIYELLSLNGNYSKKSTGESVLHLHTTLGKPDYSTFGGHVQSATVAVTAEIMVTPLTKSPIRYPQKGQPQLFLIKP